IQSVGKKFRLRQEIVATGIVFFKRFYLKNSFYNTDPFLVATTCLYSACKVEELPHHLKSIVNEVRSYLASHKVPFKYEYCDVAEFECYLLEELDFYMIVYHPYRTLIK
ncbi:RNA polymerase II holoenzyme cyclin-like subunit, partial [Dispira simplex]